MKRRPKNKTAADLKAAAERAGFKTVKITKVVPPTTVETSKAYARKAARAVERKKAKIVAVPKKYQAAISKFGLGAAQKTIRRRGRYYAGAGLYQIQKHKLKAAKPAEVQNVYSWEPSDKKGWYVKVINGVPQKKLARYKEIRQEQRAAFKKEKIRVVAAKTGLSQKKIREIIGEIRKDETRKLKAFRKTAKYKKFSKAEKRRLTIASRTAAVFGALADFLGVFGSGQAAPEIPQDHKEKKKKGKGKKCQKSGKGISRSIRKR
jgi:hypothetical protein